MIEETLEAIARHLGTIADTQLRLLNVAEWNKARLSGEAPAKPEQEAPAISYDELKAKLIAAGVEVPKGTKMTTLLKLWDKHGSAAPADAEAPVAEAPVAEAPVETEAKTTPEETPAPSEAPAAETPVEPETETAPAETPAMESEVPAPAEAPAEPEVPAKKKPMTRKEAADIITAYGTSEENRNAYHAALDKIGKTWKELEEDAEDFDKLVNCFRELKGESK